MHQAIQKMATVSETDGGLGLPVKYIPTSVASTPSQIDGPSCTDYGGTDNDFNYQLQFDAPKMISKIIW